jgi:RND family efflux transporter MFP subunit
MKRVVKIALVVAALAVGVVGAWGYLRTEEPEKVTVIKPSLLTIEKIVTATGTVESSRIVLVTAEPGARVASIRFKEQQVVHKGQVLATLDESDLRPQLDQHQANLALAEGNLASGQLNLQRLQRLYEKGFTARQEVESAERQIEVYRTQIADRKAAIAMVEVKLARTSVLSPVHGVVKRQLAEVGGVSADTGPRPGPAGQNVGIAEIAELGSVEFRADVDQADIAKLRAGLPATVQIDAFPERTFQTTVREIAVASTPDPTGRVRYEVKLTVGEGAELLKVGMSGSSKFVIAKRNKVLALPVSVIVQQGDEEIVYVLEDQRAIQHRIKTGLQGDDVVEVVSGLNLQDLVIDQGRAKLRQGRRVEIMDVKR